MLRKPNRVFLLVMAVAALSLAGCADSGSKQDASATPTSAENGINTSGDANGATGNGHALGYGSASDLSQHSVYFDTNKSTIKPQYQSVIDNWSRYLLANPTSKVQLQGNTDERGTRSYNVALGENRADAVAQAMKTEGVSGSQISVISYGKERPVCTEHDESCLQQNRRADIVQQ